MAIGDYFVRSGGAQGLGRTLRDWFVAMTVKVKREFEVEHHPLTGFSTYDVTGDDLERLERETLTVGEDFSFALASLTSALSFTATFCTVKITDWKTFDAFCILTIIGYLAALFFGIRWFHGRRQFRGIIKTIRERGGPLTEEVTEGVVLTGTTTPISETEKAD